MPAKTKLKTTAKSKKTTTKATKKTTMPKAAAKKVAVKTTSITTAYKKSQLLLEVAEATELTKKQVTHVLETLQSLMHRHLKKGGAGEFTLPGLLKCVVKRKPATKARKGISPFNGEMIMFKAKPARNVVKIRALKKLKAMVE